MRNLAIHEIPISIEVIWYVFIRSGTSIEQYGSTMVFYHVLFLYSFEERTLQPVKQQIIIMRKNNDPAPRMKV